VNEYGEEIQRLFDPSISPMHREVPESQLITYNPQKQVSQFQVLHPRTNAIELDRFTLLVWIDGACRDNGKPSAQASWGVYFGPGSRYNASGRLAPAIQQTSSRAEIEALSQALDIIAEVTAGDMTLQEVRIMSDSEYLVMAMSVWISEWIEAEGENASGRPVAHFSKLKAIHERLDEMTYGDNGGLDFKFWLVPREKNTKADALAEQALSA
jgi:ribonuclease HI